ncbi:MAG: cysteine--tRNA ligase [Spirochaetales bacterium]|nr:cysteine--tRNA ligase [Spirochaetales bacterium]
MDLRFYNSMGRELQDFVSVRAGKVGMYGCGPTVYNYAHIGNLRTYIFEDILRRVLEFAGYEVTHVMNVTDVGHLTDDADDGEDKMEKSARESGRSVWDIAEMFTGAFFHDTERLNILRPSVVCRATDHIAEMIGLVSRLEERGFTYEAGGNIYFSIDKFPAYGRLALLDSQRLVAGARVEVDAGKRNPHDFVLWFTRSKFENQTMVWDSPWGRGYPGWHLECSAMSMRYLGEQFDIHCGGIDHIPVHHTNEIAQSEAATGKCPWVKYWLHGEFLIMDRGKMSKSRGGFLTLDRLVEEGFSPLDFRYFCLGGHYRSQLKFSFDGLASAASARANLMERISRLDRGSSVSAGDSSCADSSFGEAAAGLLRDFEADIGDDLNMPKALADLWALVKHQDIPDGEKLAAMQRMDRVLGLNLLEARGVEALDSEIEALIQERLGARKAKNFARADEIRDILKGRGILLEDSPDGTRWKRV